MVNLRMEPEHERQFREFVSARTPALLRTAFLLTGNQQAAEDLLQQALAKTAARWRHIRGEPEAYVRRVIYHEQVSWWRRRRLTESPSELLPDLASVPDHAADADLRMSVRAALAELPRRQRVVVVLRYLDDLSESEVARQLDLPLGTIRALNHRGVRRLRQLCGDDLRVSTGAPAQRTDTSAQEVAP